MSRHKLVKTMNLDDELDDFDGGSDYDYDEEGDGTGNEDLSAEDKGTFDVSVGEDLLSMTKYPGSYVEQLQEGTAKVRSVLGSDVSITDKEIQDSLWHFYYDVEKTITYLLSQRSASKPKKGKKGVNGDVQTTKGGSSRFFLCSAHIPCEACEMYDLPRQLVPLGGTSTREYPILAGSCSIPLSAVDYFRDSPWLDVPLHRRAEITIEPLYPRGRLLGGSSTGGSPKVSKLAALAAARKKKDNAEATGATPKLQSTTSVALLDKLSGNRKPNESIAKESMEVEQRSKASTLTGEVHTLGSQARKYPTRKRKDPSPPPISHAPVEPDQALMDVEPDSLAPIVESPSLFARAMLGSSMSSQKPPRKDSAPFAIFYSPSFASAVNPAESNPFAGPSPDDIVANAQNSKGSKSHKSSIKPNTIDKAIDGLTNGVIKVAVDDTSRTKSKNLDVLAEFKKAKKKNAANFVVIGHVDAGKSTLMGRLLYDLKVVDQRTIDKYRKEAETIGKSSFALAWVLDQGTEERSRGVTIDIAMNKFETEKTSFTILDAPGHRDFIPNMIAGASQADFAVLVIDASTGSFESGLKGQTKEHALLVRSMGVQRIVVAINKLDTVQWSKDRFEEIEQQISAFLAVAGFQPKNISFIPCSGLTGENIVRRATDPQASWYTGPILIEQLETSEPISRALGKPLRLTIGDIFRGGVQNPLLISGRVEAGSVQIGDKVLTVPSGETAYVKGIEVDQEPSDWAVAGQNAVLHLTDIDSIHLKSGDVICPPSAPVKSITTFTTKILAFEHITPMHVDVHRGRLHVPGRITQLTAVLDKGSGAIVKKKPRLVQPGSVARVVVEMEAAVPLEAPGRVVLRAGGETVAAGLLE